MEPTPKPPDTSLPLETAGYLPEFSLVLGGLLFRLGRRTHLSGESLELVHRLVLAFTLIAWLPLLMLSFLEGHALGGAIRIPFLHDVEANVRFLVALPVLIFAELVVHRRISPLVRRLMERRIVVAGDLPRFARAVKSAHRARDVVSVEAALLVLIYSVGLWIWRSQVALGDRTWYAMPDQGHLNLTWAGYWYVFVSVPLFQFILIRWYLRLAIWFRLLWQISRLNLHLTAAHPDRAGGIGLLGGSSYAFGPILFAQGAMLSGWIADRVLYEGRPLLSFKMEAAGFVGFFVLAILGPLVMFTPHMVLALRKGSGEYGMLASRFVFAFEDKWMQSTGHETNDLLSTEDIRTLSELENVYSNVRQMRLVPFGTKDVAHLAVITAVPLLPLSLTMFSPAEVLKFLVKIVFH
jgi:hypothetical protein